MSIFGKAPIQDVSRGAQALAADLQLYLRDRALDEIGWAQPDALTLLVPLFATKSDDKKDAYLLRLCFDHYPAWPPSALFVNPLTLTYKFPDDARWVPSAPGHPEIAFHTNYRKTDGQLICCSLTLEFYKVNHSVKEELVWNGEKQKFPATVAAIKRVLLPPYYVGRSAV
ncbi:MAG TPA: hypothetical protein VGR52_00300 [Stellaceae bacterium]|nr:hypothetical protein [Stellaceae bacterium]